MFLPHEKSVVAPQHFLNFAIIWENVDAELIKTTKTTQNFKINDIEWKLRAKGRKKIPQESKWLIDRLMSSSL